ncbi:MAG: TetR/AcrR family transcriptional regulator [Actinomycetota bacterium]|jgi:AcrR family transcriptional regulator|nr:TetR/AcrR family transcriptional regulator [Actinomycetota bacterium]
MPGKRNPARSRTRRNSRQAIIEAALQCFAAKNYDGASMSDIAEATGITKRAIYRYFPTKRELFYAVRNEVYSTIVNHLWRELPPAKDFFELADALMRSHLRFGLENPEMLRIVVNTISEAATREFQENIDALLEDREEELERLVQAGIEEGTLDPSLDPGYLAWIFILIFYFLTYMVAFEEEWILSHGEEAASLILRPILDSLAPRENKKGRGRARNLS